MPNPLLRVCRLAFAASMAACATGRVVPVEPDRNLITTAELAYAGGASLYEAIRRLRPTFLRTRGPSSVMNPNGMGPAVVVDHTLLGGIEKLAELPLSEVRTVHYLAAWDATTRYGSGYANGVIAVTTWTGRRPAAPY